jgi:hypothetical protein
MTTRAMGPVGILGMSGAEIETTISRSSVSTPWIMAARPVAPASTPPHSLAFNVAYRESVASRSVITCVVKSVIEL